MSDVAAPEDLPLLTTATTINIDTTHSQAARFVPHQSPSTTGIGLFPAALEADWLEFFKICTQGYLLSRDQKLRYHDYLTRPSKLVDATEGTSQKVMQGRKKRVLEKYELQDGHIYRKADRNAQT